ncbi:MAG: response regulator [Caulobacteraceae bacterium]|nr:response regulator [Caulobacteraceae bacterium]
MRRVPQDPDHDLSLLIERLEEGAAICDLHGRPRLANRAWRLSFDRSDDTPLRCLDGLFAAFLRARREGLADGWLAVGGDARRVRVTTLGPDRFFLRVQPTAQGVAMVDPQAADPPTSPQAPEIAGLPAPFGAALVQGDDPFMGAFLEVNEAFVAITGRRPGCGDCIADLLTDPSIAEARAAHAGGRPVPFEVACRDRPDASLNLYLARTQEGWAAYVTDVTEQKGLQRQLAQRNKLEAVGQLAGGVAHDFNNLLTAIRLRADELLLRHTLGDPSYDNLAEIRETVLKAADVVRQLLTFSRKATLQRETLDLGETLIGCEVLLRRLLHEDARLETDYGRNLPAIRTDKAQLENAVMNLVVNARDAVRAKGGGVIRLRAARVTPGEAVALGYVGTATSDLALIEVSDDGPGIPEPVIGHIFEPFFTTKGVGDGTGLGLATVYGLVKQSEGYIGVHSPPGEGATFRIFLPEAPISLSLEPPGPAIATRAPARDLSGVGRILLVEDEALVRGIAARLLRTRGYEVMEAPDGEAALAMAKANAGQIDLMISDVIMPGMDGPTLLKAARPYLGASPVMFISGYAEAEFSQLLEGETGVSFLGKPLDIITLAERVKEQLRGG